MTDTVVNILASLTLFADILIVVLAAVLLFEFFTKSETPLTAWISRHVLLLMFVVALTATCGSLFLSEIAGWTPCKDCWLQRIFLYPQALLLAIALWKRDRSIAPYIIALCVVGIALSTHHYTEQVEEALKPLVAADPAVPCDATGVSCAKTEIHFRFGYITIPFMALSASLLNAMGSWVVMRRKA